MHAHRGPLSGQIEWDRGSNLGRSAFQGTTGLDLIGMVRYGSMAFEALVRWDAAGVQSGIGAQAD